MSFLSYSQTNATNYYPGIERGREPESAEVLSENNPKFLHYRLVYFTWCRNSYY